MSSLFFSVGVKRLELSTPCTPCKCASQLRHTPMLTSFEMRLQKYNFFSYVVLFFKDFFCYFCIFILNINIYSLSNVKYTT